MTSTTISDKEREHYAAVEPHVAITMALGSEQSEESCSRSKGNLPIGFIHHLRTECIEKRFWLVITGRISFCGGASTFIFIRISIHRRIRLLNAVKSKWKNYHRYTNLFQLHRQFSICFLIIIFTRKCRFVSSSQPGKHPRPSEVPALARTTAMVSALRIPYTTLVSNPLIVESAATRSKSVLVRNGTLCQVCRSATKHGATNVCISSFASIPMTPVLRGTKHRTWAKNSTVSTGVFWRIRWCKTIKEIELPRQSHHIPITSTIPKRPGSPSISCLRWIWLEGTYRPRPCSAGGLMECQGVWSINLLTESIPRYGLWCVYWSVCGPG